MKYTIICLSILSCLNISCTRREDVNVTPVRIAYPSSGTIMNAQVGLVFDKTDLLKRHGFKAELHPMSTGREMKVALVSGAVDVILTSEVNFVVLLGEGYAAAAIGSLGSAGRLALVTAKNSGVQKLAQLKNKSIATMYGTSIHEPAVRWSKTADAKLVSMSQIGAMMAALKSGQVDAIVSWDPYLTDALQKNEVQVVAEEKFELITVASEKYLADHPQALDKLNSAFREAVVYTAENKPQVNEWFAKMSGMNADVIHQASLANRNYGRKRNHEVELSISPEYAARLQATADFLFKEKLIRLSAKIADRIRQ